MSNSDVLIAHREESNAIEGRFLTSRSLLCDIFGDIVWINDLYERHFSESGFCIVICTRKHAAFDIPEPAKQETRVSLLGRCLVLHRLSHPFPWKMLSYSWPNKTRKIRDKSWRGAGRRVLYDG